MSNVKCMNPWDYESKRIFKGICYAIEGNTIDRASAKNGKGFCENISPTLNTQDRHAICFHQNQRDEVRDMGDCAGTLTAESRMHNTNYLCISLEGNGVRPSHLGVGYSENGKMYTLNTIEHHSVCYSVDCRNMYMNKEKSATIQAKNGGGHSLNYVNPVLVMNDE